MPVHTCVDECAWNVGYICHWGASFFEDVPLVDFMNLQACCATCIPGESYRRWLRYLLYLRYIFWALINSLVRWFWLTVSRQINRTSTPFCYLLSCLSSNPRVTAKLHAGSAGLLGLACRGLRRDKQLCCTFAFLSIQWKRHWMATAAREMTFSPTGWRFPLAKRTIIQHTRPGSGFLGTHGRCATDQCHKRPAGFFTSHSVGCQMVNVCCVPAELPPLVWARSVTYSVLH